MTAQAVSYRAGRAATSVSRHGVRGTAQRAWRWIVVPCARQVLLRERHVWLRLRIVAEPPPLPAGYVLRRGGSADLQALAAIGGVRPDIARRHLAQGAELYLATRGGELAFSVWNHVRSVPLLAAVGGQLALPEAMSSLEDAIAAPAHRGTGIAGSAIEHITAIQHRNGVGEIIIRVAEDNVAARGLVRKLGATELATMSLCRIGPWRRVSVQPRPGEERLARLVADQVGAR